MPKPYIKMTGLKFGMLTVVEDLDLIPPKPRQIRVRCDCGHTYLMLPASLKNSTQSIKSCGCSRNHGKQGDRLYSIWRNLKSRCNNPKSGSYKYYGGRGIQLWGEWIDFMGFYSWAIASGYNDNLTIDRIDNDGNYYPSNCEWITQAMQTRKKRTLITRKNPTQYIGACFYNNNQKWLAYVDVDKKRIYLGYHATDIDAAIARDTYIVNEGLKGYMMNGVV